MQAKDRELTEDGEWCEMHVHNVILNPTDCRRNSGGPVKVADFGRFLLLLKIFIPIPFLVSL